MCQWICSIFTIAILLFARTPRQIREFVFSLFLMCLLLQKVASKCRVLSDTNAILMIPFTLSHQQEAKNNIMTLLPNAPIGWRSIFGWAFTTFIRTYTIHPLCVYAHYRSARGQHACISLYPHTFPLYNKNATIQVGKMSAGFQCILNRNPPEDFPLLSTSYKCQECSAGCVCVRAPMANALNTHTMLSSAHSHTWPFPFISSTHRSQQQDTQVFVDCEYVLR